MAEAVRQRYAIATGQSPAKDPPKTSRPGFKKGGVAYRNTGGALYKKGGKASKR